ncbi:Kef-type K+ transport system membrane component KefB [Bradyrhizobium japonicum]|uniref:Kef-type K+ transport system membrane component KefB n=1 Tax=Bradyrhizobium elkanii TaxID=29448 RepID=A0A1E3EJC1_BRAEL|nr:MULTISPECIES: cation:proton antiporter [Bradyrhizobium]MBP1299396.1 Kef-type K+ transport system membrane component KefB [Bradyrhizobium elkanii]MBP2428446.1 Kef-type K+ transport system membrane component KefB [Bradyrhizobium elkanii]MBR1163994.1 cation:proton antiporter [Bradyrhizobium elkanii]MCP1729336.1 Kef-type K+ transport system membrane component KefB [Bradyrhizobium elkanii]MCP1756070.1 Kef-type K+ transport system membrane component KefB [Bradyrhizobium elkanii]
MHELIPDITLCILFAWGLGLLAHFSRQPLILAYLIAGFFIGPFGMGWVKSQESISVISELGLIFMLFMIGLEIDLKKIIRAGKVILFAGAGELIGGCLIGVAFFAAIGLAVGGGKFDAIYLCVACALSSTVIIVKVLYEKRELDTLPGRITLGVLVLQDIFAILFLAVQPSLDNLQISVVLLSIARVAVLVATALVLSRYVLPRLFHQIARRPELVLLGALAWCFLIGEIAERLHLSREMGSLVAGVSISTFPYALDVTAKVTTLRDFFITLFFVALGMTIPIPGLSVIWLALVIAAFTVASRLITTFTPLYLMKQGLRASLLPAINLAQISEFSLVVIQTGVAANHIGTETASAASFAFVVLAVLSTFAMARSDQIVRGLIGPLKRIGLRDLDQEGQGRGEAGHEGGHGEIRRIVILGFFRAASALISQIERQNQSLLEQISVIDFNPLVFRTLSDRGMHVIYGDISNVDTLVHAGIGKAEIIILSVPDFLLVGADNEKLVRHVRALNPTARIVATADLLTGVDDLYSAGADYVTVTRLSDAGELYSVIEAADAGLLDDKRAELDVQLSDRREVLP